MKLNLSLKKRSNVEIVLPMSQEEANETANFIQDIAQHMTYQNWQKLANDFRNDFKRKIALKYINGR